MNRKQLSSYIFAFLKLNPKKNKRPNIEKYDQNSFFVIQNSFKENKKYIITSNYNHIFYYKKSKLQGKKWVDIFLYSKDIFEYHKLIRDEFPYCNQKKFVRVLIDDLFYWFDRNTQNSVIEATEINFDLNTKKQLEKIRYFLDQKDWSNYFFNLQKLMHEQIIYFLSWNKKKFNYEIYNKDLKKILDTFFNPIEVEKYLNFVKKVNLYRNTISKVKPIINQINKHLFETWNVNSNLKKQITSWEIYFQLVNFITVINLLLNEKSI